MWVETWGNGNGGLLPANCSGKYETLSNLYIKFDDTNEYSYTTDHSKYGISETGTWVCIGDINR